MTEDIKKLINELNNKIYLEELSVEEVIKINLMMKDFPPYEIGEYFVKLPGQLESSIEGPKSYYYDNNLDRVVEVWYRLTKNHCFHNANKRTATYILLSKIYFAIRDAERTKYINLKLEKFAINNSITLNDENKSDITLDFLKNNEKIIIELENLDIVLINMFKETIRDEMENTYEFSLTIAGSLPAEEKLIKKLMSEKIISLLQTITINTLRVINKYLNDIYFN